MMIKLGGYIFNNMLGSFNPFEILKSLIKNALTPLAKNVLVPLGLRAAVSATNATINKILYH